MIVLLGALMDVAIAHRTSDQVAGQFPGRESVYEGRGGTLKLTPAIFSAAALFCSIFISKPIQLFASKELGTYPSSGYWARGISRRTVLVRLKKYNFKSNIYDIIVLRHFATYSISKPH